METHLSQFTKHILALLTLFLANKCKGKMTEMLRGLKKLQEKTNFKTETKKKVKIQPLHMARVKMLNV